MADMDSGRRRFEVPAKKKKNHGKINSLSQKMAEISKIEKCKQKSQNGGNIGCITKIFNFPLYCASSGCWRSRKTDASSKQHILKMAAMLKPSAEYNRRAVIIEGLRAGSSVIEIIRFFAYPRSTIYDVMAKYTALEQSNENSSMLARKSHSKERTAKTSAVIKKR